MERRKSTRVTALEARVKVGREANENDKITSFCNFVRAAMQVLTLKIFPRKFSRGNI